MTRLFINAALDITPAAEKAIDWVVNLGRRQFVGTESRLMTVFALLREIAEGTEVNPSTRIAELEKRKAQIEQDIQRIREGRMPFMDSTGIKDRFLQMASTAGTLLSDFREVEQNFRQLDRAVRERIATWAGGKGALLEDIFGQGDHGYVFIQETTGACIACMFPDMVNDDRYPCPGTPAIADIVQVVGGLAVYATDTLLMKRNRNWNYRRISLSDASLDGAALVPARPNDGPFSTSNL